MACEDKDLTLFYCKQAIFLLGTCVQGTEEDKLLEGGEGSLASADMTCKRKLDKHE